MAANVGTSNPEGPGISAIPGIAMLSTDDINAYLRGDKTPLPDANPNAPQMAELMANEEFRSLIQSNIEPFRRLMTYYHCAMMEIETKFRVLDAEFSLRHERRPIESIHTRIKSTESLVRKLVRKGFPITIESIEKNIFDVAGVRVVCSFPADIFALAESLLAQDDIVLIERRDYIANPKPSGYRSLHLIVEVPIFLQHEKRPVKVEVQLRTISMNFWATLEHQLRYKKHRTEEQMALLSSELLKLSEDAANLDSRMQNLLDRLGMSD